MPVLGTDVCLAFLKLIMDLFPRFPTNGWDPSLESKQEGGRPASLSIVDDGCGRLEQ
jgi:hypothetical protein